MNYKLLTFEDRCPVITSYMPSALLSTEEPFRLWSKRALLFGVFVAQFCVLLWISCTWCFHLVPRCDRYTIPGTNLVFRPSAAGGTVRKTGGISARMHDYSANSSGYMCVASTIAATKIALISSVQNSPLAFRIVCTQSVVLISCPS